MSTKNTQSTSDKVRTIVSELGDEFFERRAHLEAIWIGLLADANTYLLGPPGTGKSLMVRAASERVTGADYWEILLDRQLPLESIFGPLDIVHFRNTGEYHRNVTGYAPTAHFAFLDEVGKAGPAVLNPMLTWLNEKLYHNNSKPMSCNLLTAVGASNEELEEELEALWDRWMLRLQVEPIQEPSNFAALISQPLQKPANPTTVTLDEILQARNVEVPNVTIPPGVVDNILKMKAQLKSEHIDPSDRRWKKAMQILRAQAWLNGRSSVDEDDLSILQHVLWEVVEQVKKVEEIVLKFTSELTSQAIEFQRKLDEIDAEVTNRKGQSVENRARYGGEAQSKVGEVSTQVEKLREKANREGRSTAKLDEVVDRAAAIKQRIFVECLNVDPERAKKMSSL